MNVLPFETRVSIASALVEGMSIRAVERLLGVHRDSIMRFGVVAGEACADLHDRVVRDVRPTMLQLDEAWSYVGKKQGRCTDFDPEDFGDQYLFVGLDAVSKLVVSYLVEKRTAEATQAFCYDLRARVLGAPQINTDGFKPYLEAVEYAFGAECSHGMAVKQYASQAGGEVASVRYAPNRVIGVTRIPVSGNPVEADISTSYVERQNLTLRMGMKRMARLTNGYSKKLRNLKGAVALHFGFYNFCRVHETTRVTPAMQAGLTDHVWSVAELLRTALDGATPARPATRPADPEKRPALRMIPGGLS